MSHTNTTTNYGLPQFLSSDKPAWMADINVAFADIDTQMKLNADAAADAQSDVNDASLNFAAGYSNASTYDVGDVVVYNNRMYICDVAVTVPESFDITKWTYYRVSNTADAVENLTSAENALESLVGSTDISAIGDGTVTGAIDTINTNLSDIIKREAVTLTFNTNGVSIVEIPSLNSYWYDDFELLSISRMSTDGYIFLPYVRTATGENAGRWYVMWLDQSLQPVSGNLTVYASYIVK